MEEGQRERGEKVGCPDWVGKGAEEVCKAEGKVGERLLPEVVGGKDKPGSESVQSLVGMKTRKGSSPIRSGRRGGPPEGPGDRV